MTQLRNPVLTEQLRVASGHELERALDLVRYMSDAVLAMGARHRVTSATLGRIPGISLDQIGGYYLLPIKRLETLTGRTPFWINGWRCDRVVRSPLEEGGVTDIADGRIELVTCHRTDTLEAIAAWTFADIQRQWIAEALDDYLVDEYSRPRYA